MERKTHTSRKLWLSLVITFAGAVGLIITTKPEPQAALQEQWSVQVDLTSAKQISVFPKEHAVGRLKPARRAILSFEAPGRIVQRLIEPGTRVSKGQPLAQLADGDARDLLEEAESQYQLEKEAIQRDRELLALAKRSTVLQRAEVKRLTALEQKALTSISQLDAARQTVTQLRAEEARLRHSVRTAAARLALKETQRKQAIRNLERTTLRAPFAGTINSVEVDVGDYVSLDQPVVELVDLNSLDLYVEVRGAAVDNLELGQTVTVKVDNREMPGRLQAVQYDPNPSTHTHALRIRLVDQKIRPGTLAAVALPRTPIKDAMTLPFSAILNINGENYVFHYDDGMLYRKAVVLGPRVGDMQVVRSGILEGDRIVARDVAGLSDGQMVEAYLGVS